MKQEVLNIRLQAEDKEALEKFAKSVDMSMSQVVRIAIKDYLSQHWPAASNK